MTDERSGDTLWRALSLLPPGSGIVFRHHATPPAAREALFARVRAIARRRRLVLVLAGPPMLARSWRADGAHGRHPHRTPGLLRTAPVHDRREMARAGAVDLLFLSPVFPTRSHPGGRVLGRLGFRRLARATCKPVVALGGMNEARWQALDAHGWAAIDAWSRRARHSRDQNLNAVPT